MRYIFSRMSILGCLIAMIGFLFTIQGIIIRYHLTNINESYNKSEIKNGRYIECDIPKEYLIGTYYSEGNGTIKYSPYCVEDVLSSVSTYIVAVNEDSNYYVPLIVSPEYEKDFRKMINGETNTYHIFGKFEKFNNTLYYDAITKCTGIDNKSKIHQMISTDHQIEIVDLDDEKKVLYKGFSLLLAGLLILFATVTRKKI